MLNTVQGNPYLKNSESSKEETSGEKKIPRGEPSWRVLSPKLRSIGEIHFNRELAPSGKESVIASNYLSYTPDISGDFYDEIDKALRSGLKFVLCLIDVYSDAEYIEELKKLVVFCKDRKIDIINFEFEPILAKAKKKCKIANFLPQSTPNIVKPMPSIFSTPETHDHLRRLNAGALIIAGEFDNCCIRSSIIGIKEGTEYFEFDGEEFGAVEYGYSVYTQKKLIKNYDPTSPTLHSMEHERLYKFSSI
ncbi:cysteine hydrolase [Sansalvadorimonas sp. 2012CJ34-2]|uniref:Cysteine hydrolase n=1 Tax=Parendozoicomonas callyspongiae TaxID=2942213 RepID=A0ABT0PLD1_9GAMM|nr:cysteine hydrolase [Sansalvadorimonas sp. 2012CJ34-2]MCL6272178.1 cysteine hydrolase [Sansalvadorimonas sp. 2012CJ34-2]